MNNNDNDSNDSQAVAPERQNGTTRAAKPGRNGVVFAVLLALLALLAAGGGVAAGYWAWMQLNHELDAARQAREAQASKVTDLKGQGRTDVTALRSKLQSTTGSLEQRLKQLGSRQDALRSDLEGLQDKFASLRKEQKTLNQAVSKVYEQSTRGQRGWQIAEVKYLMRMANNRLRLERDVEGARAALTAADQRLHQLSDPRLLPVREQLANEIHTLRQFEPPDITGIALRLDRMLADLEPFAPPQPKRKTAQTGSQSDPQSQKKASQGGLKGLWNRITQGLQSQVTLTRNTQPVDMLAQEGQAQSTQLFLQQKLIDAKFALLNRDDKAFHRQLSAAMDRLQSRDQLPDAASRLLQQLSELSGLQIRPELPDITGSLTKLKAAQDALKPDEDTQ